MVAKGSSTRMLHQMAKSQIVHGSKMLSPLERCDALIGMVCAISLECNTFQLHVDSIAVHVSVLQCKRNNDYAIFYYVSFRLTAIVSASEKPLWRTMTVSVSIRLCRIASATIKNQFLLSHAHTHFQSRREMFERRRHRRNAIIPNAKTTIEGDAFAQATNVNGKMRKC